MPFDAGKVEFIREFAGKKLPIMVGNWVDGSSENEPNSKVVNYETKTMSWMSSRAEGNHRVGW